jgi:hypothetical protein
MAGSSIQSVERVIGKLEQKLGEAKMGNEEAEDAFAKLGLSADKLSAMKPEDQFIAVSKALVSIEDWATRAAVANDLLGKGWREAWGAMKDASSGFDVAGVVEGQKALNEAAAQANAALLDQKKIRETMARQEQEEMRAIEEGTRQGQSFVDYVQKLKEDLVDLQTGRSATEREAAKMLDEARRFYSADEFRQFEAEVNRALDLRKQLERVKEDRQRWASVQPGQMAMKDSAEAYNLVARAQVGLIASEGAKLDKLNLSADRLGLPASGPLGWGACEGIRAGSAQSPIHPPIAVIGSGAAYPPACR